MSTQPAAKQVEIPRRSLDYVQSRGAYRPAITSPARAMSRNGVLVFEDQENQFSGVWEKDIRALMIQCSAEYPLISIELEVVGGIPHLRNTRISVGQVLGRIYMLESIQGVVDYYQGRVSLEQIKEALAYAQDFIETACEPLEDHG